MKSKIVITNSHNEKLVGQLHETGSKEIVVLCHGRLSNRNTRLMKNVATAIEKEGISAFRFDFSGNGDSEGSLGYGKLNYEVEDLHSVIKHFENTDRVVNTILGHSEEKGIEANIGERYLERIEEQGFIDVKTGKIEFRVTMENVMERINTNMHEACLKIDKECKVLTIHGSEDEIVSVEDAKEFANIIPNHELEIIEGANHGFTQHQTQLVSTVMEFIKTVTVKN